LIFLLVKLFKQLPFLKILDLPLMRGSRFTFFVFVFRVIYPKLTESWLDSSILTDTRYMYKLTSFNHPILPIRGFSVFSIPLSQEGKKKPLPSCTCFSVEHEQTDTIKSQMILI